MNFLMVTQVTHLKPVPDPSTIKTEEPSVYDVDEFKRLVDKMPVAEAVRFETFKDELVQLVRTAQMPQEQLEQAIWHLMGAHGLQEQCVINLEKGQFGYVVHMNTGQPQPPVS